MQLYPVLCLKTESEMPLLMQHAHSWETGATLFPFRPEGRVLDKQGDLIGET
jgi:hypothetical protein